MIPPAQKYCAFAFHRYFRKRRPIKPTVTTCNITIQVPSAIADQLLQPGRKNGEKKNVEPASSVSTTSAFGFLYKT